MLFLRTEIFFLTFLLLKAYPYSEMGRPTTARRPNLAIASFRNQVLLEHSHAHSFPTSVAAFMPPWYAEQLQQRPSAPQGLSGRLSPCHMNSLPALQWEWMEQQPLSAEARAPASQSPSCPPHSSRLRPGPHSQLWFQLWRWGKSNQTLSSSNI